jgi:FdhE protein
MEKPFPTTRNGFSIQALHGKRISMETTAPVADAASILTAQMDNLAERKPSLKEILQTFRGVLLAGAELRARLSGLTPPNMKAPDISRLSQGVPLLHDADFLEDIPLLTDGFQQMLRAVEEAFPVVKEPVDQIISQVKANADAPVLWLKMVLQSEEGQFKGLAEEMDVPIETLKFALEQAFKPFFQWLADISAGEVAQITWDRGYCPICGSYPDTSFLKKGEEEQEYLVAHGGQRWLHCGLCSHEWRLHRVCCPYCGTEETDALKYLSDKQTPHERLYVCHKCNKSLTCMDLSELIEKPLSDLIPFELLHLDVIARHKGFSPLAWLHWNQTNL